MLDDPAAFASSRGDVQPDGLPLARRIANHFRSGILEGEYVVGARLPTVRSVAARLGTTPQTVAAAYRILSEQGLVRPRAGAGTVVLPQSGAVETDEPAAARPAQRLPLVASLATPSFHETYRRLLHLDREGTSGGFASYTPALELYPGEVTGLLRSLLRRDGPRLFQMGGPEGDAGLRAAVSQLLVGAGGAVTPQEVVVTGGAQEGLALAFRALAAPGDAVVVESPTYIGALEALVTAGVRVVGVPVGPDGVDPDEVSSVVSRVRAKVFYTMPSFQNPTGHTMSLPRRRRLLAVARRHGLVVVEDAAAAELHYDGPPPPPLLALDRDGLVVHVGTFSKTLFSGIRLGYVVARGALVEPLLRLKYVTNVHVPLLLQRLGQAFLAGRRWRSHLARVRPIYRARRDAMLGALGRDLDGRAAWTAPGGGFSLWLTLPPDLDAADLFRLALERGVSFVPGAVFFPEAIQHHTLRLCFSSVAPDQIGRGVAALAGALGEAAGRPRPSPSPGRGRA
jgi:DNA-binding transcriptional MocR family regulator